MAESKTTKLLEGLAKDMQSLQVSVNVISTRQEERSKSEQSIQQQHNLETQQTAARIQELEDNRVTSQQFEKLEDRVTTAIQAGFENLKPTFEKQEKINKEVEDDFEKIKLKIEADKKEVDGKLGTIGLALKSFEWVERAVWVLCTGAILTMVGAIAHAILK